MNGFTGDAKYIDVLERSMYNGALAGISLAGDRFFYVNPLASKGAHHRQAWYGCACCPSQVSRFIPSIGNYIYGTSADAVWVNLYIGNSAEFKIGKEQVKLLQETDYPWDGTVKLTLQSPLQKDVRLRIPAWCKTYSIAINDEKQDAPNIQYGYAVLSRKWKTGDQITLNLDMPVELVAADPRVKEDIGKRAVQRGPIVYCAEAIDNGQNFDKIRLSPNAQFTAAYEQSVLNGVTLVKASVGGQNIKLIPYYAWDNREAGEMKVWLDYEQ